MNKYTNRFLFRIEIITKLKPRDRLLFVELKLTIVMTLTFNHFITLLMSQGKPIIGDSPALLSDKGEQKLFM